MRVLFIGEAKAGGRRVYATTMASMFAHLPCEYVQCTSAAAVEREVANGVDVVILGRGPRYVPFWPQLTFLNDLPIFIAKTCNDCWHPTERNFDNLRLDAIFACCPTSAKRALPGLADKIYGVLPSCDMVDIEPVRDIDILFWGGTSSGYPLRQAILTWLHKWVVGEPRVVNSYLTLYDVIVNKHEYTYARLTKCRSALYTGKGLLRLIARVRICPTGTMNIRNCYYIPVGKYFENAAAGAVTMTNEFTDREAAGFEHEKNIWIMEEGCFVDTVTEDKFIADITYLLEHREVCNTISANAKELVWKQHTREARAQEVYKLLCTLTGKE